MKDLNIRPNKINLPEEDRGEKIFDISLPKYFSDWIEKKNAGNKVYNEQIGLY